MNCMYFFFWETDFFCLHTSLAHCASLAFWLWIWISLFDKQPLKIHPWVLNCSFLCRPLSPLSYWCFQKFSIQYCAAWLNSGSWTKGQRINEIWRHKFKKQPNTKLRMCVCRSWWEEAQSRSSSRGGETLSGGKEGQRRGWKQPGRPQGGHWTLVKKKKCNHVIISGEGNANCVYLKWVNIAPILKYLIKNKNQSV